MNRLCSAAILSFVSLAAAAEPLPSWRDGATRDAIVDFVDAASSEGSEGFVPANERIAVFDNDGTLWAEQPAYFQLFFAMDRVRAMADQHPQWKDTQPFKAVLENDMEALADAGMEGVVTLVMASHAGNTAEEFEGIVRDWIRTARHPTRDVPYTSLVYQPMLELLEFLRANGFQTWIVSGGGIEFLRVWAEEIYGVPPAQVVGSSIKTRFENRDGRPVIVRLPEIDFVDDKDGKPVGIHRHIGRRPVMAFGNSDGDHQMLQYTAGGDGPRLMGLIHHTDAEREWAYDRDSHIGRLDKALDEARRRNWVVVDMKSDWARIFP
jgi:phosphoglycolate phosphatase-like HAD superfamily hydrolase